VAGGEYMMAAVESYLAVPTAFNLYSSSPLRNSKWLLPRP
jgi:hypothetical protein